MGTPRTYIGACDACDETLHSGDVGAIAPLCACCGDAPSAHVDGSGDAVCGACYASGLEHGHANVGHDEPVEGCPSCERQRGATYYANCAECGHDQRVYGDWLVSGQRFDDTCDACGEARELVVL